MNFFVVPTVTFRVLFVFVILACECRRVVHFYISAHPTAEWTAQQVVEAFPWDEAPHYRLRNRDRIYGNRFQRLVCNMGIEEVLRAPRSPGQNPYMACLIGSTRRDCLNHVIVLHERHLQRILASDFLYYHAWRMHMSLATDYPKARPLAPPEAGEVIAIPEVEGHFFVEVYGCIYWFRLYPFVLMSGHPLERVAIVCMVHFQ